MVNIFFFQPIDYLQLPYTRTFMTREKKKAQEKASNSET